MRIKSLTLNCFKSFRGKQTLAFYDSPGLYFLTGENRVETELEGNGAGKSTLLDALSWVLYGKTLRKVTGPSVHSWGLSGGTEVELALEVRDHSIILKRTWNPNSLRWRLDDDDWKMVEQGEVEDCVGLSFESFCYSVIFGQFNRPFLDLRPAEKDALFSELLSLDEWNERSDYAKRKVKHAESALETTRQLLAEDEGGKRQLEEIDFEKKIEGWEKQRQRELEDMKASEKELQKELSSYSTRRPAIKSALDRAHQLLDAKRGEEEQVRKDVAAVNEDMRVHLEIRSAIQAQVKVLLQSKKKLEELPDVCPTCGGPMSYEHRDKELRQIAGQLQELQRDGVEIESLYTDFKKTVDVLRTAYEKARQAVGEAADAVAEQRGELKMINDYTTRIEAEVRRLGTWITGKEREENPFIAEKEKVAVKIDALNKNIENYKKEIEAMESSLELVRYWVTGFKSVRLMLISDMLAQLELEANNTLFRLGLPDWRIEFVTEKETKSKTVQKAFQAIIYSPMNDGPVPWEVWSGGESQRLRLASSLGLSNLILLRNGVSVDMQIFDEPSNWMSATGVRSLLDVLSDKAVEEGKRIIIADHRDLDSHRFSGIYKVTKDSIGSKVELQ